jgi:hypothetical protein
MMIGLSERCHLLDINKSLKSAQHSRLHGTINYKHTAHYHLVSSSFGVRVLYILKPICSHSSLDINEVAIAASSTVTLPSERAIVTNARSSSIQPYQLSFMHH